MKHASVAFLLAFVAFCSVQDGRSALVLFDGEEPETLNSRPTIAGVKACKQQVENICSSKTFREDLLFEGVANKLTCLAENQQRLDMTCVLGEMNEIVSDIVYGGPDQCRQEIRKKCGKQIDALKKSIQNTEIIGTVKGAVDVVECLVSNSEDLWNKCKPQKPTAEATTPQVQEVAVIFEVMKCHTRINSICPMKGGLLFDGAASRLGCLAENAHRLDAKCSMGEMDILLENIVSGGPDKCRQEIRNKCGKQIDELKNAIKNLEVVDAIRHGVDLTQCLASNAEDFWNKCKPEGPKEPAVAVAPIKPDSFVGCKTRAEISCPLSSNKALGLGLRAGCLAEHATELGSECLKQEIKVDLGSMDALQGSKCHDAIRDKCGKQIDQLKKAIQDTSVLGIVKSALDVTQCMAQNAEDLFNKCRPFSDEPSDCEAQTDKFCPKSLGLGQHLGCLAEHAGDLGSACMQKQVNTAMVKMDSLEGSKCQDELRNKCGKQIDQLKKAIRDNALFSILVGTVEVAQCLSQNAQDIADKCKPFTGAVQPNCQEHTAKFCQASTDIVGMGRHVGCLAEHSSAIGSECMQQQMVQVVADLEAVGGNKCQDELRNKCGKQIDQFKKAVRDSAVLSLLIGAFEVAQCISQNAQDIADKCRPFTEVVQPNCQEHTAKFCQASTDIVGMGRHVGCLAEHSGAIGSECMQQQMVQVVANLETVGGNKCQDELRNKCGKQIDQFKKAVRDNAVLSLLIGAFEVAQCISQNAADIADKCRPFEEVIAVANIARLDCDGLTERVCPIPNNKILGVGYHVGCLAEHVNDLGADCVQKQMVFAMANVDALEGSKCHDELMNKCGKQIDQLKKAIRDTALISIVKSAVDVAQCTAQNAEDLWNKCKPFQELSAVNQIAEQVKHENRVAGSPTSKKSTKPTKKPTTKPTAAPTKKSPSKPSNKPTSKAISDAIVLFGDEEMSEPAYEDYDYEDDDDEARVTQVSSLEIDMDACVRSARKFCSAQVAAFNASPFDKSLMETLNLCIESNAAAIEAECVVKESRSWSFFPEFFPDNHHHDDRHPRPPHPHPHPPHPHPHPPHPHPHPHHHDCDHHHHHRRHHAAAAAVSSVFVFLAVVVLGRRIYLSRQNSGVETGRRHPHHHRKRCCCRRHHHHHHRRPHHEESAMASGTGYQRIKSDDASPVPVSAVVVGNIV